MTKETGPSEVITIKYADLAGGQDVSALIMKAYGDQGLGALAISGVPGYSEARRRLLLQGHKLAHLSEEEKAAIEDPVSMYNAGWSFGREKLGDKPDTSKGSFYANPILDEAASAVEAKTWPAFYPPNIWPSKECMPDFEAAFKELGRIMYEATLLLAKQIDRVLQDVHGGNYAPGMLFGALAATRKVKGRMLYYYPCDSTAEDSWIGWHNDSGFLTALTSAIFVDDETGAEMPNPDPEGGLYIVDRAGGAVRARIPADCLGVQCGEVLQIISGGRLKGTPHCVRASRQPAGRRVGRTTFPVFVDADAGFLLAPPKGCSRHDVFDKASDARVPPLEARWTGPDQAFADFLTTTFQRYYEHAVAAK